jgi:hypothetical protein
VLLEPRAQVQVLQAAEEHIEAVPPVVDTGSEAEPVELEAADNRKAKPPD